MARSLKSCRMQSKPSETKEWAALASHAVAMKNIHMNDIFVSDSQRFTKFHLKIDGILLDFSRHRATRETLNLLTQMAKAAKIEEWREKMFAGKTINASENRAALHPALRGSCVKDIVIDGENVKDFVEDTLERIRKISVKIRDRKKITDIVSIGIGGSDLGTRIVYEALQDFRDGPQVHFVSNVDGARISAVLNKLDHKNTLFIVVSKTFTTLETMMNAQTAKDWAGSADNFYRPVGKILHKRY